nr:unnamed protein product [Callosobruchus analis]
MKLIYSRHT